MLCLGLGGGFLHVCLGNVESIDSEVQWACSVTSVDDRNATPPASLSDLSPSMLSFLC